MRLLQAAWEGAQKRFAIVFTIGAALSFANALSSIKFIIDAIAFLREQLSDVPILAQVTHVIGAIVSAVLDWWRLQVNTLFGWLHITLPTWAVDLSSALSFIVGRAFFKWRADRMAARQMEAARNERKRELDVEMGPPPTSLPEGPMPMEGPAYEAMNRYHDAAKAWRRQLREAPAQLLGTIAVLVLFFAALHLIDTWYRTVDGVTP